MDLKGAEIRNIFGLCKKMAKDENSPLKVRIPFYQRPYRWGNDQIRNLINDFENNKDNNSDNEYFIGSIVLVEHSNTYDVIDGQQRITTVYLLCCLKYMLQRARIQELIRRRNGNLIDKLQDLNDVYKNVVGSVHVKDFENMISRISNCMDEIDDDNREDKYNEIEVIYCNCVGIPVDKDLTNTDKYMEKYESLQEKFLSREELGLSYSRDSYNTDLKTALQKICITVSKDDGIRILLKGKTDNESIEQFLNKDKTTNKNSAQYLNALNYEFCHISNNVADNAGNMKYAENLLKYITEMLSYLKFCVIMTGNEKDAYTLFEVLNDRALEIDDLELIKNLFLKAYCLNTSDDDLTVDRNIGILDSMWGEKIFVRSLADGTKKNISLWGTIYLTGDTNIGSKQVARYREPLDNLYLGNYNRNNMYSFQVAQKDIGTYYLLREIINEFGLHVQNVAADCIAAENDSTKSETYKTLHLLNALKQTSVLPALTNYIIGYYFNKINTSNNINIDEFKDFISKLIQKSNTEYNEINRLSNILWQVAMKSCDFKTPRSVACKVIKSVNRKCFNLDLSSLVSLTDLQAMDAEYDQWISEKCYGKAPNDLKAKILFMRLIKTSKQNDVLSFSTMQYQFTTNELQLDHLEAQNPSPVALEKYFEPKDKFDSREKYIHGLGNMMILDDDTNNNKNNKPLVSAISYYKKIGSGNCWVVDEIEDMMNNVKYHEIINGNKVPNEEFFKERAHRLKIYFKAIIGAGLNVSSVKIDY